MTTITLIIFDVYRFAIINRVFLHLMDIFAVNVKSKSIFFLMKNLSRE